MFRSKTPPLGVAALLTISAIAFLGPAPVATARLGETIAECEARYGEIRERIKPQSSESDEYAIVFTRAVDDGTGRTTIIRIVIEYKDGEAWKLNYESDSTLSANFETLLSYNNDGESWGSPFSAFGKKFWIRPDGKAHAVGVVSKSRKVSSTLTVIDGDFLKVRAADYKERLAKGAQIRAEYLNHANPLPGF